MMRNFARIENIYGATRRARALLTALVVVAFAAATVPGASACDCDGGCKDKDKKNCPHKSKKSGKKTSAGDEGKKADGAGEAPKAE